MLTLLGSHFEKDPVSITAWGNHSLAIHMIFICCGRISTLNSLETPAILVLQFSYLVIMTDAQITCKINTYIKNLKNSTQTYISEYHDIQNVIIIVKKKSQLAMFPCFNILFTRSQKDCMHCRTDWLNSCFYLNFDLWPHNMVFLLSPQPHL